MTRVTRGFVAKRRRKTIRKKTFDTSINGGFRLSKQKFIKAGISSDNDRKTKKRQFRRLWISRINALLRSSSVSTLMSAQVKAHITYSRFIHALKQNKIILNRKVLSQLSCVTPQTMCHIVAFSFINKD